MKTLFTLLLFCVVALFSQSSAKSQNDYGICLQFETIDENPDVNVFGFNEKIDLVELVEKWEVKTRKTPKSLMLAKVTKESNFHPIIFRYEPNYKLYSCGLFQVLKSTYEIKSIDEQMDEYDNLMSNCLIKSGGDIKKAIWFYNTPSLPYRPAQFVEETFALFLRYS